MSPLGVNKTVLLGVLARAPQLHYGRDETVRALLSLVTRVLPVGAHGELPGSAMEDVHLVYCEGSLAERMAPMQCGALVYLEGRNREQRMKDPSGKSHRLAYVSATIARHLNNAGANEGANSVTLVGTVMREPIVKQEEGQHDCVKLRVMTTHRQHDEPGDAPSYSREYHWVSFYGRVAEFVATRGREGSLVYIEGRNQPSRWTDSDALTHRTITIVGHYFQLLKEKQEPIAPPVRQFESALRGYDVQLPEEEFARSFG
jgi:single-strand DNA-binding protein